MNTATALSAFLGAAVLAGCGSCRGGGSSSAAEIPVPPQAGAGDPVRVTIARGQDGRFPATVSYGDRPLLQNGVGLCEWGFLGIDLYEAALYAERKVDSAAAALAEDQVLIIHLDFSRSLSADQLREAFTGATAANTGDQFGRYEPALQQLLATMRPVEARDCYTFVADPQLGLVVQRDGRELAVIDDDEFRRLFVRLYLGDRPPTEALRDGLLGRDG
jgi:hypothetical protein